MSTRNSVIIVRDSMVKHLTGPGISKKSHVEIKTNPGATTEDIIDYIKQVNRIFCLFIQKEMTWQMG